MEAAPPPATHEPLPTATANQVTDQATAPVAVDQPSCLEALVCCEVATCSARHQTQPRLNLLACLPHDSDGTSLATKVHLGALIAQVVIQFFFYGLAEAGAFGGMYSFDGCGDSHCVANQAIMSVGLAFSTWFSIMWIGTVPLRFICGRAMHYDCWLLNALLLTGLIVGALCIPSGFYEQVYVHATRWLAGLLFLPMQTLAMIDLGYRWHDTWSNPPPEACGDSKPADWRRALLISAVTLWLLEYVLIALFWVWFADHGRCPWQNLIISGYAGCQLVLFILPFMPKFDHSSPIVSVLLGFVTTFYMFDGFVNLDDNECSMINSAGGSISLGFSPLRFISFAMAAFFALQTVSAIMASQRAEQAVVRRALPRVAGEPARSERDIGLLHAGCVVASMYTTMVATGWGLDDADDQNAVLAGIRFSCVGLSMLMYFWTLIGPLVCSGRDWARPTTW
jgi:hypothetical protein